MKNEILEILAFLFKNHWYGQEELPDDFDQALSVLQNEGFDPRAIFKTFDWLELLLDRQKSFRVLPSKNSIRILSSEEKRRFNKESLAFILYLENLNILTAKTRELLFDQLLSLNDKSIEIADVKWVALLVLLHEKGSKRRLTKLENMILGYE